MPLIKDQDYPNNQLSCSLNNSKPCRHTHTVPVSAFHTHNTHRLLILSNHSYARNPPTVCFLIHAVQSNVIKLLKLCVWVSLVLCVWSMCAYRDHLHETVASLSLLFSDNPTAISPNVNSINTCERSAGAFIKKRQACAECCTRGLSNDYGNECTFVFYKERLALAYTIKVKVTLCSMLTYGIA